MARGSRENSELPSISDCSLKTDAVLFSTSAFTQPVLFHFLSFAYESLMFGPFKSSGNQVSVWRQRAVKIKVEKEKKKRFESVVKRLFLHSLVFRGAFWHEWQTIP